MNRILVGLVVFVFSSSIWAGNWEKEFSAFKNNPNLYSETVPQKYADRQLSIKIKAPRFSKQSIQNKDYLETKISMAKACRRSSRDRKSIGSKVLIEGGDRPEVWSFLRERIGTHFEEVNTHYEGRVDVAPWSGDYWPIANGILAARVFDDTFEQLLNWVDRYNYQMVHSFLEIFNAGDEASIRQLSTSEKYDLLVGPNRSRLTHHMWSEGKKYYDRYGEVEQWMGICHGWAIAAYMMDRPDRGVSVKSYDGSREIYFYPDEIKGLASYAWANNPYQNLFIGQRCNKKDPERDENGRVIDPSCFDSNPATWHLAVTHLVGVRHESFVMDATYDYEVWNQPIHSYEFEYFNPSTGERTRNASKAEIELSSFKTDKFKKYRSSEAKTVVGVVMKVGYVVETSSRRSGDISNERESVNWVQYLYDLELDAERRVIGGEWYSRYHPDFLYRAVSGAKALTRTEWALNSNTWSTSKALPQSWRQAATQSSYRGQVLYKIVEKLIESSRHNIVKDKI